MNRYPKAFEKILAEHGIDTGTKPYTRQYNHFEVEVSKYEIVSIGLEAMLKKNIGSFIQGIHDSVNKEFQSFHMPGINNKDFCTCIDKAIREVFKDE